MRKFTCTTGSGEYPVVVGRGIISSISELLPELFNVKSPVLVADRIAFEFHAHALVKHLPPLAAVILVSPGEEHKNLDEVRSLYASFLDAGLTRAGGVVSMGGGMVSDLAGFAAATYMRGVPHFIIPTTLLAQVDAAVGGKVAVNLPEGKNLAGAFHQPLGVLADTFFLDTLPEWEFRQGVAEIIKCGLVRDEDLFLHMQDYSFEIMEHEETAPLLHAVSDALKLKIAVVEADEKERGERAILNFGHTFAHAFEHVLGFSGIRHGDAVAAGMVGAAILAARLGVCDFSLVSRIEDVLRSYGLPTKFPRVDFEAVAAAIERDKKRRGRTPTFVLPVDVGKVEITSDVEPALVEEVLLEIMT